MVVVLALAAGLYVGNPARSNGNQEAPAVTAAPVGATLIPGLGTYAFAITTSKPEAQRWFNQALMLTLGFNHDAAERLPKATLGELEQWTRAVEKLPLNKVRRAIGLPVK